MEVHAWTGDLNALAYDYVENLGVTNLFTNNAGELFPSSSSSLTGWRRGTLRRRSTVVPYGCACTAALLCTPITDKCSIYVHRPNLTTVLPPL